MSNARKHAHNGVDATVQLQCPAHHVGIGVQAASPTAVRDDRDEASFIRLRIDAADNGTNPEHVEEVRARIDTARDFRVISVLPVCVVDSGIEGERLENRVLMQFLVLYIIDVRTEADKPVQPAGALTSFRTRSRTNP